MEQVLVVESKRVDEQLVSSGFVPANLEDLSSVLSGSFYQPRPLAEGDPSFRQIIPYVVVHQKGALFTMERLHTQSETRLHRKLSCGVGGHINPVDESNGVCTVLQAAAREITEEVEIEGFNSNRLIFLGFICDNSTPVSRDHLGCLFVYEALGNVLVKEKQKMQGSFISLTQLKTATALESWTQLILPVMEARQV